MRRREIAKLSPSEKQRDKAFPTRRAVVALEQNRRSGRPTAYRPEFADLIFELRLAAIPIEILERIFGVAIQTLNQWCALYPEFAEQWEAGGDIADARVSRALYNRATGFSRITEKAIVDRRTGNVISYAEETYYPPDVAAATFWLTNRQRQVWQATNRTELSGPNGSPLGPPAINVHFIEAESEVTDGQEAASQAG